jgi:flagellar hook-length control protein FliK
MQIRLDPPSLGQLDVSVRIEDGIMSVAFQTSSDDATRLLSHSLSHLKGVLESQGVSVDKIHVQQTPRDADASRQDADQQQRHSLQDETAARQEQQRKEMLRRMWRRLALGSDPLDMVA